MDETRIYAQGHLKELECFQAIMTQFYPDWWKWKKNVFEKGHWLVTETWKGSRHGIGWWQCLSLPGFGRGSGVDLGRRLGVFLNLLESQGVSVVRWMWVYQSFLAGCYWQFDSSDFLALTSSLSNLLNNDQASHTDWLTGSQCFDHIAFE